MKGNGITEAHLKTLTMIIMIIDHTGAALLYPMMMSTDAEMWEILYWVFRCVGRIGFPLFAFMVVEGFMHTHSRMDYLRNMAIFAAVSEIPFDLMMSGVMFNWSGCSIFMTYTIGVAGLMIAEHIRAGQKDGKQSIFRYLPEMCVMLVAGILASLIGSDYGFWGILTIYAFYLLYDFPTTSGFAACALLTYGNFVEIFSFPSVIFIRAYNGKRGDMKISKYFYYAFYPLHMLFLFGVRYTVFGF